MRFLVTAGNTWEKIDAVRQWGSIFSGETGLSIARALAQVGQVDLLTSNRAHLHEVQGQANIEASGFSTHADLRELLAEKLRANVYDAVFMSAAVSDYQPDGVFAIQSREISGDGTEKWIVRDVQADKVKSDHGTIAVVGKQTEKLVDLVRRQWNHKGLLVKFKLEVGLSPQELIKIGQASRVSSGAEYLVANTLDMIAGEKAGAFLLSDKGEEWVPRADLPQRMAQILKEVGHGQA